MMRSKSEEPKWLISAEARKRLKLSTCDLAHLRNSGNLKFMKQGNAFYYLLDAESNTGNSNEDTPPGSIR